MLRSNIAGSKVENLLSLHNHRSPSFPLQIPIVHSDETDEISPGTIPGDDQIEHNVSCLDPPYRWAVLARKLLVHVITKQAGEFEDDDEYPCRYQLLGHWQGKLRDRGDLYSTFGRLVSLHNSRQLDELSRTSKQERSRLEFFVVAPTSVQRLLWCLLGVCLLTWDTLVIPVQLFPLGSFAEHLRMVAVFTSVYWLVDMPFQCLISFQYADGQEEKNPWQILINYAKTWMAVDVAVILVDVVLFVLDSQQDPDSDASFLQAGRSLRLARLMRLLRVVRLMRLRKLNELMNQAFFRIKSEHVILGIKLAKHVSLILLVNHYTACAWYALGSWVQNDHTWLKEFAPDETSGWNLYVMALHWSMTQFAPATNNIAPQNPYERAFAVCVVLFALISFSSFISSVTNTVNELKTLKMDAQMEELRLREFLFSQKVSPELVGRILKFFKQNYRKRQKRIHEQDITFFQDVPESMKIRLHEEVYKPVIVESPMFNHFLDVGKSHVVQVCHMAMMELFYVPQQDVFVDGTPSSGVYFVRSGRLTYHSDISDEMDCVEVNQHQWISEMCLWVEWNHCGQLSAEHSSELVRIDKVQFNTIVSKATGPFLECLRRYAVFVLGHIDALSGSTPVTDMSLGRETLENLASKARRLWELERRTSKSRTT